MTAMSNPIAVAIHLASAIRSARPTDQAVAPNPLLESLRPLLVQALCTISSEDPRVTREGRLRALVPLLIEVGDAESWESLRVAAGAHYPKLIASDLTRALGEFPATLRRATPDRITLAIEAGGIADNEVVATYLLQHAIATGDDDLVIDLWRRGRLIAGRSVYGLAETLAGCAVRLQVLVTAGLPGGEALDLVMLRPRPALDAAGDHAPDTILAALLWRGDLAFEQLRRRCDEADRPLSAHEALELRRHGERTFPDLVPELVAHRAASRARSA